MPAPYAFAADPPRRGRSRPARELHRRCAAQLQRRAQAKGRSRRHLDAPDDADLGDNTASVPVGFRYCDLELRVGSISAMPTEGARRFPSPCATSARPPAGRSRSASAAVRAAPTTTRRTRSAKTTTPPTAPDRPPRRHRRPHAGGALARGHLQQRPADIQRRRDPARRWCVSATPRSAPRALAVTGVASRGEGAPLAAAPARVARGCRDPPARRRGLPLGGRDERRARQPPKPAAHAPARSGCARRAPPAGGRDLTRALAPGTSSSARAPRSRRGLQRRASRRRPNLRRVTIR